MHVGYLKRQVQPIPVLLVSPLHISEILLTLVCALILGRVVRRGVVDIDLPESVVNRVDDVDVVTVETEAVEVRQVEFLDYCDLAEIPQHGNFFIFQADKEVLILRGELHVDIRDLPDVVVLFLNGMDFGVPED